MSETEAIEISISRRLDGTLARLASIFSILAVAASIVVFNGGIAIGSGNHVGLLPVVRRILNPQYLQGDFNIELRLYHHRVFAGMLAGLSALVGEDRAVVTLHLISVLALSAALFYLCRTLKLPVWAYLLAGFLLSVNALWIGLGLEENNFVGNPQVQPPTLAHAFVLAATAALILKRWRLSAFFAGLTALLHLQIGFVFTLLIVPFFAKRLGQFGWRGSILIGLAYFIPAAPAIWNAQRLLQRGVSNAAFSIEYLRFRMPHHFELSSTSAGLWFVAHVLLILAAFMWFRHRDDLEARALGVFLTMSLLLTALVLVHALDYQWLHFTTTLKFQFPRLSPLVTVFGGLTLLLCVRQWQPVAAWPPRLAVALLVVAGAATAWNLIRHQPERFSLTVQKYAEQQSGWVDICRWVKANGKSDVVYLAPPGRYGFTYLTDRSSVIEFKTNPDGGQFLPEWTERLEDFCGGSLPTGHGLENRRLIDRAYAALPVERVKALGVKYNAPFAILPQSSTADLPVLYSNRDYRLVEVARF